MPVYKKKKKKTIEEIRARKCNNLILENKEADERTNLNADFSNISPGDGFSVCLKKLIVFTN